jgi:hypothetical protein
LYPAQSGVWPPDVGRRVNGHHLPTFGFNSSGSLAIFAAIRRAATALKAEQQLRQFRHIDCDPSRLVAGSSSK